MQNFIKQLGKGLTALCVAAGLGGVAGGAAAHTISIGYENAGPGAVTFWYGSYHAPGEFPANATEGSMTLVGVNGNPFASTTVAFDLHTGTKPGGLVDGDTNFFADNSGGLTPTNTLGGLPVRRWQGVTFSGLTAGDYQFTYEPITSPSATWAPWNQAVRSSTVTLTSEIVDVPEPAALALFGLGLAGLGALRRVRRGRVFSPTV